MAEHTEKTDDLPPEDWTCCGYVDAVESGRIYGWAWNPTTPDRHLEIDIFHNGQPVESVVANRFRSDLLELGIGDGRHAFVVNLPPALRTATPEEFSFFFHQTSIALIQGARMVTESPAVPPADGDAAAAGGSPAMAALQHRVEHLETSFAKLLNLVALLDRQGAKAQALESLRQEVNANLRQTEELGKSMQAAEGFLLRFDEDRKTAPTQADIKSLARRIDSKAGRSLILLTTLLWVGVIEAVIRLGPVLLHRLHPS